MKPQEIVDNAWKTYKKGITYLEACAEILDITDLYVSITKQDDEPTIAELLTTLKDMC